MRYERSLIALALVCLLVAPAFAMPSEKGAWNCHYGGMFLLSDLTKEEMENMTLAELEELRQAKMDARQEERENMTLGELRENCSAKGNGKAQPAGGSCPMSGCADNNMRADQGRGDQAMFGGQNMRGGQDMRGGFGHGMGIDVEGPGLFLLMDLTEEEMEDMTLAELKVLREEKMEEIEDMTLAELKALREDKMENMTIGEMKGMCGGLGGIDNLRGFGAGAWGAM